MIIFRILHGMVLKIFGVQSAWDDFQRSVNDTVLFERNVRTIDHTAETILLSQIEWFKKWTQVKMLVEGHCDPEEGTVEICLALGEDRAKSAVDFLVNHGIERGRIQYVSYGKERPITFQQDELSRARNRRVVTIIR